MAKTVVVIPTISNLEGLWRLVTQLLYKDSRSLREILIYDNGMEEDKAHIMWGWENFSELITIRPATGASIYEMWNRGLDHAQRMEVYFKEELNVFFLNDDVQIYPGTVKILDGVLHSRPDYGAVCPDYGLTLDNPQQIEPVEVTSTFGAGGLAGFAFMRRAKLLDVPEFDENFGWWYGDDDFVKNLEKAHYKAVKVKGLPVEHVGGASSANTPNMQSKIAADNNYFNRKWGENRGTS